MLNSTVIRLSNKWLFFIFDLAVTQAFMEPAKYPGSSGTRNLSDNLSDLKAQVAANQKVHVLAT